MFSTRIAPLCLGITLVARHVHAIRNTDDASKTRTHQKDSECDVSSLSAYGDDIEMGQLASYDCECVDEDFASHTITNEADCLGTPARKKGCNWNNGACSSVGLVEMCEDLPKADSPQGCTENQWENDWLGCISTNPRPLALGSEHDSVKTLLTNTENEICYFNSAIITLFAGSNDFVSRLTGSDVGKCFNSVRRSLARIVRAMRNQAEVQEDAYVRKMMQCVRADCADVPENDMMMLLAQKEQPFGEPVGVLTEILLPALDISSDMHNMEYTDCNAALDLVSCLQNKVENSDSSKELQIFVFNQEEHAKFEPDFKLYESGRKLTVAGTSYTLWAGTAATRSHVVSWTLHPSVEPVLTVYDDLHAPFGIQEHTSVEAGFAQLNKGEDLRIKMVIFKKDSAQEM